jgi:hypothetical protein
MYEQMLTLAEQAATPLSNVDSALPEALRISGIALLAIFFVMGLFGALIALLTRLYPDNSDESE